MIWLRRKRRNQRQLHEAALSRRRAEEDLARTRAETPKYKALAESLRELREANNFAAAIETSFRGGKQ